MQSKWTRESYKRPFIVFSSSLRASQARLRLAWKRSLRVLLDWENLPKWLTPSLSFSLPLSTLFQGRPKIQISTPHFNLCCYLQDDPAIPGDLRWQELRRSYGLERVWRLWRLWAGFQEMASDVENITRRHARWHEHLRWRGWRLLSISMDHGGLKEVSSFSVFIWPTCVQVFLEARGDHPTHPKLVLPRRPTVPTLDSWGLVWSHSNWIYSESPIVHPFCSGLKRKIWNAKCKSNI